MENPRSFRSVVTQLHLQTYESFVDQFERTAAQLADETGEQALRTVSVSRRQLDRWLRGQVKSLPRPRQCRILEHMLGHKAREMFAAEPVRPDLGSPLHRVQKGDSLFFDTLTEAADFAKNFVGELERESVGASRLDQMEAETLRLIGSQARIEASEVLPRLRIMQDEISQELDQTRPLERARRLHSLLGVNVGLMARCALDLGFLATAVTLGRAAAFHAQQARDDVLASWLCVTQSQVAFWRGHHARAEEYARAGLRQVQVDSEVAIWLHSVLGRALAAQGRAQEALDEISVVNALRNAIDEPSIEGRALMSYLRFPEELQLIDEAYTRVRVAPNDPETRSIARSAFDNALALDGAIGQFGAAMDIRTSLALLAIREERWVEALALITPAEEFLTDEARMNGLTRKMLLLTAELDQRNLDDADARLLQSKVDLFLDHSTIRLDWA